MWHHIPRQFLETENASGTMDLNHTLTAVITPTALRLFLCRERNLRFIPEAAASSDSKMQYPPHVVVCANLIRMHSGCWHKLFYWH